MKTQKMPVNYFLKLLLTRSIRTTSLIEHQAPDVILKNEHILLDEMVENIITHFNSIAKQIIDEEKDCHIHTCPCFFCGHRTAPDYDIDHPEDAEPPKCAKNNDINKYENNWEERLIGCHDYDPKGAMFDRTDIKKEIDNLNNKYSNQMVLKALKLVANKILTITQ